MSDIRELLRQAVGRPNHQPEVAAMASVAHQRAHRRRLAIRAVAASAIVVVVAAGIFAAIGNGDGRRVEIAAGTDAGNADAGVSLTLPEGWQQLPLVERDDPKELVIVGTAPRPEGQMIDPCNFWGDPNVPAERSAYVTIYEYDPQGEIPSSRGGGYEGGYAIEHFQARPADFRDASVYVSGDCPVNEAVDATEANRLREIPFTEDGRLLLAYLVSAGDPDQMLLNEAFDVLNTLQVGGVDQVTTTTTTAIPGFDETAAEQQILDAINAANGAPSPVPFELSIEGGHPFADPAAAEVAAEKAKNSDPLTRESYEGSQEGKLVGRINWIVFESPIYARLNFDLLNDGQLATANTTGYAVFEDGFWRLGRGTFCEIAARGGVDCPA